MNLFLLTNRESSNNDYNKLKINCKGISLEDYLEIYNLGDKTRTNFGMNIFEMLIIINNWIEKNENELQYLSQIKENDELYSKIKLPYIDHKFCPRNKEHKSEIKDIKGNIRCIHHTELKFNPKYLNKKKYFDELSLTDKIQFKNELPERFTGNYQKIREYEREEDSLILKDYCYAIIQENRKIIMPLETVLKRLNTKPLITTNYCNKEPNKPCQRLFEISKSKRRKLEKYNYCIGHQEINEEIEFPFNILNLTLYIRRWYEQQNSNEIPIIFEK